jgi:hypothetical protein
MAGHQQPAWAKYGDSSSMELPNYIEYLIEKNRQIDDSQVLYRGADPAVLLERLQDSLRRLNEIPTLANEKKWTQINGTFAFCVSVGACGESHGLLHASVPLFLSRTAH